VTDQSPKRRAGGRSARVAARRAGPAESERPVRPGQIGGRYKPLTDAEVQRIHHAAMDVLERIGMAEVPREVQELALAKGCHLNDRGRLCYPKAFMEDVLAGAARTVTLYGQDPKHDFEIGGQAVRYGTGGAAVRTLDMDSGVYRPSTLVDLHDFARIADTCENLCWFTRCVVATDVPDTFELDVNTAYAIARGTSKPIGTSFTVGEYVEPVIRMFDTILGGEGRFRKRPFCKVHISPVVSPLRYGEDAVGVTKAAIANNMPINAIIAAQSGATAPAPLAGMLVHSVAETLAALVLVNLYSPGYPMIFSNWPFVIDLRTGAFSGSGGEITLLNAAAAQMANFYDLPGGVSASMADSKVPDAQSGYEKAISTLATGLAGANMVYESFGMFASLLGASFEGMIIDDEMMSYVQRVIRGFEISEDTIGLNVIEEVVNGPGHFLGHDQTIAAMQRDYYYPSLGDRSAPDVWAEEGATDIWARARVRARAVLADHHPDHVTADADAAIRERYPILLPRTRA
jgi:trimethylamine--corrinoid protein Co-methyltransferase